MQAEGGQRTNPECHHHQQQRPRQDARSNIAVITDAVDDDSNRPDRQSDRWCPTGPSINPEPSTPRSHVVDRRTRQAL